MNDTEPSPQDLAAITNDLTQKKVVLLIYNQQVTDPTTDRIRKVAENAHILIVGVSELLPANAGNYLTWYENTLDTIKTALQKNK